MPAPDDSRFEWIHAPEISNEDQWVRGRCNHLTPEPVHAQPTGELVAYLCVDCDAQLPAEWAPIRSSVPVPADLVVHGKIAACGITAARYAASAPPSGRRAWWWRGNRHSGSL